MFLKSLLFLKKHNGDGNTRFFVPSTIVFCIFGGISKVIYYTVTGVKTLMLKVFSIMAFLAN